MTFNLFLYINRISTAYFLGTIGVAVVCRAITNQLVHARQRVLMQVSKYEFKQSIMSCAFSYEDSYRQPPGL